MNVSYPFGISKHDTEKLVRFFSILHQAESRVSSHKVASAPALEGQGLLDKLTIFSATDFDIDLITRVCNLLGFKVGYKYLKDKNYYARIIAEDQVIDCCLGKKDHKKFRKISFNPSRSKSFSDFIGLLKSVFGHIILESRIYRLDLTVDLYCNYSEILSGLDIRQKQSKIEYSEDGIRTGLIVGKKNDKYVVYDKSKKEKETKSRTRIERQLSAGKVPIKNLHQLSTEKAKLIQFEPFKELSVSKVKYVESDDLLDSDYRKLLSLKTLIENEGLLLARKKLSSNRNFWRDYGKLIDLTKYQNQPSEIFETDIQTYLGG